MGDTPLLSGGQRQRFSLARLLLFEPDLVLLDEPTAHLGDEERAALEAKLLDWLAGKTLLWASHEPLPEQRFTSQWRLERAADDTLPVLQCAGA